MKKKYHRIYTEEQVLSVLSHGGIITDGMIESLGLPRLKRLLKELIPDSVSNQSRKMNVDLEKEFLKVILCKENFAEARENLIALTAGVTGTVLANQYYQKHGYKVENEVPILDENGQKVSSADIRLTDANGDETYVEIKTSRGVISKSADYPQPEHPDDPSKPLIPGVTVIPRENFDVRKVALKKIAISTGQKAVEQIQKYRLYLDSINDGTKKRTVKLGVFKGTTISKDIRKSIEKQASIEFIPVDVNKIFDYCTTLVVGLINEGRNTLYPPRGLIPKNTQGMIKASEQEINLR